MQTIGTSSFPSFDHIPTSLDTTQFTQPKILNFQFNKLPTSSFSRIQGNVSNFKLFTTTSSPSSVSTESFEPPEPAFEAATNGEKFDWYSQWYPVVPVCDLDKRVPHAKKVMGLDVVVWWDRNESAWKVFDDTCPHRLAPLSEGRIDQWGRLQCVYHGWCFNGFGDCKLIPQAPPDGPPVHKFKKACVAVYPSTVHHDIVWFWPNTDPQYKDIITKKKPPSIPALEDPPFTKLMGSRDFPYGYDVLIENLMDPAHVAYAHYGIISTRKPQVMVDREGGRPIDMSVKKLDKDGYIGKMDWGCSKFIAPCIFYAYADPVADQVYGTVSSSQSRKNFFDQQLSTHQRTALIFICIPVCPGNSRLIWSFPRNFGVWTDKIIPRWMCHVIQNLILDSDLYLVHVQERKIMDVGPANWQKACFVPTKSDALVVGFRRWLNKYAGGQVDWRGKYSGALPPTPRREQLMDRYWSHVVNCRSCSSAHKCLSAIEVILPVISLVSIGIVAAAKQGAISAAARSTVVALAVVCFAASRWLSHFIYKTFHYHDYNHALH
ncbi:protochlorophyllide-dependent translocon component 52, chloroplastic-like isoform X1 [Manihot esculenta]|uniref:Rieske domain-containing protein n=1 Tax=Manihot esculenta TaxID=3983 RepID=A0A2C9UGR8_MANES|nr:protochlorophyllide-dependent translocon component 52, chloroplastic-like isoform X1 [Manihot esculenta]OAY28964.1 hypothetical protein MANES_15G107500v8 [Manihot esculenta]